MFEGAVTSLRNVRMVKNEIPSWAGLIIEKEKLKGIAPRVFRISLYVAFVMDNKRTDIKTKIPQ